MAEWHAPIDPECPEVQRFTKSLFGDPMTKAMGAPADDIMEDFEHRHRKSCEHCREFGAANIEVR